MEHAGRPWPGVGAASWFSRQLREGPKPPTGSADTMIDHRARIATNSHMTGDEIDEPEGMMLHNSSDLDDIFGCLSPELQGHNQAPKHRPSANPSATDRWGSEAYAAKAPRTKTSQASKQA